MIRLILGTRPEAIKLLPVVRALKKRGVACEVVGTGQHADLLAGTGIRLDHSLQIASSNDPEAYVVAASVALQKLHVQHVTTVVVQGDTASAVAGAEAAAAMGIPVAHIESGLRSHDMSDPWPEEGYRVRIDALSTHRYCPTGANKLNLVHEGLSGIVTGNTITDALRHMKAKRAAEGREIVLVTLHRRESFGEPLKDVLRGLAAAAHHHPGTPFCWPMHPNPKVQEALDAVGMPPNVLRRGPMPYADFLMFLCHSKAVLTDSGGVVEEAVTLGIPAVIARNHTERAEAMEVGAAKLVGTEPKAVMDGMDWALEAELEPSTVFGSGYAADRIADHLRTL